MTIGIVTDSTCDLPAEILGQLGIIIVPMYVNLDGQSYLDGIELSREEFYARLPDSDPPPTTAIPGLPLFLDAYKKLADDGATEIMSIHVSSELSGVVDAARVAARQAPVQVTVVDSGSLTLGLGFLVQAAAEAVAQGRSVEEIVVMLKGQRRRTHVFAVLDTLEYLRRSGRMNRVMATIGTWLRIKPLLRMTDGKATADRIRTTAAAMRRLLELLEAQLPLERVALVHTHALEKANSLRTRAQQLLPAGDILSVDITPVLGAHLGPGAVGFACVTACQDG